MAEKSKNKEQNPIGVGLAFGATIGIVAGATFGTIKGDMGFWMGIGSGLGPGIGMCVGLFLAARPSGEDQKSCSKSSRHGNAMQTSTRVAASTPQTPRPQNG